MASWQLQDAKNRFSAVVNAALAGEPQQVTRRGEPVVVVVSVDEYERLRKGKPEDAPTFVEHLLAIPQGGDFDFERLPLKPRDIDF
ncbi:MAG: type II toxin-antitoxin system prevent-host-death family antitoxin [Chloroflexi bacterium]|nr:type II toxin-antitoxin system prevent-host-death family antitoxin [Chloroflexota bacterium]MYF79183.1 type II toxin-antitoxin system prevent-host-death family antitoxin [Chloroflexota bacterium]MYK60491.1 type II toxin-antitoxin system prevent-host-death family antitoxin [Chloroflexota bacterium]